MSTDAPQYKKGISKSQQMKRNLISIITSLVNKLPQELPNDLRLKYF